MKTMEERFWSKVEKTDTCWNWTAAKATGYGRLQMGVGKQAQAHRISYEMASGPIEPGLVIDHMCHNRACVNPEHLRAATQKQNLENRRGADSDSKTGVRGVYWNGKSYHASVQHNRARHFVGHFASLAEAEAAVIAKRNELFTHNLADRIAS